MGVEGEVDIVNRRVTRRVVAVTSELAVISELSIGSMIEAGVNNTAVETGGDQRVCGRETGADERIRGLEKGGGQSQLRVVSVVPTARQTRRGVVGGNLKNAPNYTTTHIEHHTGS